MKLHKRHLGAKPEKRLIHARRFSLNSSGGRANLRGASSNRKGVIYTVVAIILLIVIANIFFTQSRRGGHESVAAVADRVQSVNDFIKNLQADSQRAAYISGFHTFIAMEQYATSTGQALADPSSVFRQIFLTGNYTNTSFLIMENSTFNDYLSRVQANAGEQGIMFSATVTNVSLWQVDPWNVLVNYTIAANITDSRGTAKWNLTQTFIGTIPITDIRDPLFTVRTYGRIQRVIKKTNVSLFVNDTNNKNDTTGLLSHFNSSVYIAAGRGPNILMRFAGNISDDQFGIESLVDTDEFIAQNLPTDTTLSVVDYLYFNSTKADACSIQNLPSKIKFDNGHLSTYQVQGQLTYSVCP